MQRSIRQSWLGNGGGGRQGRREVTPRPRCRPAVEALEDRTVPSVTLVEDVNPGAGGSDPRWLTAIGSRLFFTAEDQPGNREPWVSDGTAAGTHKIKDIAPGGSTPKNTDFANRFVEAGGVVFFAAEDASSVGLWRTDGTEANTARVGTVELEFDQANLTAAGGLAFFRVFDPAVGRYTLWRSDGTDAGTFQVTNAVQPFGRDDFGGMAALGDRLLFVAGSGLLTIGPLWVSDGTAAGTRPLTDFEVIGPPDDVMGHQAFFRGRSGGSFDELWATDGTVAGTRLVVDLNLGDLVTINQITPVGDRFFFTSNMHPNLSDLWVSDGTAAGTRRVDLPPGVSPSGLYAANGRVYFEEGARDANGMPSQDPIDLWVSDGTAAGSYVVKTGLSAEFFFDSELIGDSFYFHTVIDGSFALWVSDGTVAGTVPVGVDPSIAVLGELMAVDQTLYVIASDAVAGQELYKVGEQTNVAPRVEQFRVTLANGRTYDLTTATRRNLPWAVTGVQVVFSEAVTATLNSLSVTRNGLAVALSGFSGSGTNTLTWTFGTPVALGQVNAALQTSGTNAVRDLHGASLETARASHSFSVALGDVSGDGRVNIRDLLGVAARALVFRFNPAAYDVFFDLNLDGRIDAADVGIVLFRLGTGP